MLRQLFSLSQPPLSITVLLLVTVAVAGVYDLRFRRIPNWLTGSGVLAGMLLNSFLYAGWPGLKLSFTGLLIAFAIYVVLYALHAMGAGDVKLMAAIGAMVGWENWLGIFLFTAVLGGGAALVLTTLRGRLKKTLWNVAFILSEMKSGRPAYAANEELDVRSPKAVGLPHGVVIAVGTVVFLAIAAQHS